MQTEFVLISDCQKGNTEAFAELYDIYVQKIYSFIFHKVLHTETAEDLTSDTFLKALEKINTFNPQKAGFSTWLFQIARNTVIDHYRTYKSESDIDDVWDLASSDDVLSQTDARITYEKLQAHLKKFSSQEREILMMRFWQDMSYADIAAALGKTEASVKMAASRAVKKLKQEFLLFLLFSTFLSL